MKLFLGDFWDFWWIFGILGGICGMLGIFLIFENIVKYDFTHENRVNSTNLPPK
jgi:hypothetical protein